jgi:hypothetical protein
MKKFVNLSDHCPPELFYRLTHLQRPHFEIQPGAMPQLQFLHLRVLLHLRKYLLIEELPWFCIGRSFT